MAVSQHSVIRHFVRSSVEFNLSFICLYLAVVSGPRVACTIQVYVTSVLYQHLWWHLLRHFR